MGRNQARFTRRYSAEQRYALLEAVIVDLMPVAEAVRKASAGTLKGTEACEWGRYAYGVVNRERDNFEATSPEALARAIETELHDAAVNTMRQLRRLNKAENPNPVTVRETVQALRTLKANLDKPKPAKQPETGQEKAQGGVLGELLAMTGENGAT